MKKTLLIATIILLAHSLMAQNIPSTLLKGLTVNTDEFTGETTYSAKNCCLSIVQGDSTKLYISLTCSAFDRPIGLKKIHILTNGKVKTIEQDFIVRETPVRQMKQGATGTFGTPSYRAAVFETRMRYDEQWKEEATPYMETIESITTNLGKVKFEGDNDTRYLEFKKKDAQNMLAVLRLYNYLMNESR